MHWSISLIVAVVVFVVTLAGTGLVLRLARARDILDHPNERSSHSTPTPKGAGIAVIGCIAMAWLAVAWLGPLAGTTSAIIVAALALGVMSWFDDLRGLGPFSRLLAQIIAVTFVMSLAWAAPLPEEGFFGGLLPVGWDVVVAGIIWVWFINLFNFMDGIDGLAGVETAAIGIGVAIVAAIAGLAPLLGVFGIILTAAALGFLWWNWHPAKIFLGDVGSVPLGFLLGWLLLQLAANGQGAAALILPLYYLGDATITLLRRGLRGEKVWQAHREHFYQQATSRGLGHAEVVRHILLVNIALIVLAAASALGWEVAALISAVVVVAWLLYFLSVRSGQGPGKT
ncbi:MAG: glycosyltransferase family 4 protein [Alphaproteobacteria bacterium]|nr:glycosyltransferase family 4 protein [Alphaproteobacteria bacterium]